jgi:DNA-binding NtrC family response regulator
LISATCEDLELKVAKGGFRHDLYQRLKGMEVESVPFRDLLLEEKNNVLNTILSRQKRKIIITTEGREALFSERWNGNIRELARYVEKLVSTGVGIVDKKKIFDLNKEKRKIESSRPEESREEVFYNLINLVEEKGLGEVVDDLQEFMIHYFYEKNDQKTRETISKLKISNNQFYKYIKK